MKWLSIVVLVCHVLLTPAFSAEQQVATAQESYRRGTRLAREGKFSEALQELSKAAELEPDNGKVHNALGVVLTQMGRLEEAEQAYNRALAVAPELSAARKNRAVILFDRGDFKAASKEFAQLARLIPEDFVPHLFLGLLAIEQGQLEIALKHLSEARLKGRDNGRVLIALAKVSFFLGRRKEALQLAEEAGVKAQLSETEQFELATVLAEFGVNDEAEKIFRSLWQRNPTFYKAGFNLALARYRGRRSEAALQTVEELLSRGKRTAELLSLRGWIYNQMGRLELARRSLEQAVSAEPDNADHYLDLSTVEIRQGDTQAALQVLLEGIRRGAARDRLEVQMGLLYHRSRNFEEAEKCYRRALDANPESAPAHVAFGTLLLATNRQNQALDLIANALKILPDDSFLHHFHGAQLLESALGSQRQALEEAEQHLKRAAKLNPFYAETHYLLGRLYLLRRDDQSAQISFERAADYNPRHLKAHTELVRLAVKQGNRRKVADLTAIVRKLSRESQQQEQEAFTGLAQASVRREKGGALRSAEPH